MTKEDYMKIALNEAKKAFNNGDVPIGALIVYEKCNTPKMKKKLEDANIKIGQIISKAYNKRNKNFNAIDHAEIIAIKKACKKIKDFRLDDLTMYVTLEPCQMCAGAIVQSRIKNLVIGTKSLKSGSCGTIIDILSNNDFNHKVNVEYGVLEEDCKNILKQFFKKIRD